MRKFSFLFLLLLCVPQLASAAELAGRVIRAQGVVEVFSPETQQWRFIHNTGEIYAGETIRTGNRSRVSMRLEDETMLLLRQNSYFTIEAVQKTARWNPLQPLFRKASALVNSLYELSRGSVWMRNNNRRLNSRVRLPTVALGIRGTEISLTTTESGEGEVAVLEGAAAVESELGELIIDKGQLARLSQDRAPQLILDARPQSSVHWTIQFPQHLASGLLAERGKDDGLAEAIEALQASEFAEAKRFLTGRQSDTANLMLALIELLTGNHDAAERILQLDYSSDRSRSVQQLLLGYQAQLRFDLGSAEQYYRQALQLNAENQAARYHLAVLYFGMDRQQQAVTTIDQLLASNPGHTGAEILRGFLLLSERQTEQAAKRWSRVLESNPGESDAWFGLSLAQMRQGSEQDAFASIASAVALNPQSSLYLSYWGKMLYQVKRYNRAQVVLESAARLDPRDPTPVFYLGLIHQELNQPGEAIARFQQAISLNDNQGIYRSRSLLDKDLAVRNIDLAQSFVKLGLRNWASKKATDAIQRDYSNYSAHLMQAGAFDEDPKRAYLFLNEALQSLMFVPATANSFSSYNHYSSMLEQPELNLSVKLEAGSFDQQGLHGIVSAAQPDSNIAYNLSLLHEQSDGWRDSNSEEFDDLTGILKWQPSDRHNSFIQLSVNQSRLDDDLFPRYEIDAPADTSAIDDSELSLLRLGHHFHQNHEWDQLFYFSHSTTDRLQQDHFSQVIFDNDPNLTTESDSVYDIEQKLSSLQWQAHYKSGTSQLVFGILGREGTQQSANDYSSAVQNTGTLTPLSSSQTQYDLDYRYLSTYINHFWQPLDWLQTQIGVYDEKVDQVNATTGGEWETDETLPRIGLTFQLSERQALRLASFEYILPDLEARLDPTSVAGIPITRNLQVGSQIEEDNLQWEYELDRGLLKINAFDAKKHLTISQDLSGSQIQSTLDGEIQGAELTFEYMLGSTAGLSVTYQELDINDDSASNYRVNDLMVNSNRDEKSLRIGYNRWFKRNYRVELEAQHREMVFKETRADEQIDLLNTAFYYESNDKSSRLALKIQNLTDEEFNWVTDPLVISGFAPRRKATLSYEYSF